VSLEDRRLDTVLIGNTQTKALVRRYLGRPGDWSISKFEMKKAAQRLTGEAKGWTGDSADAFWVGYLAARFWLFRQETLTRKDLSPYERKVFTEIKRFKRGKKAGTEKKVGLLHRENEKFFLWSDEPEINVED
jgi:hypothetical protein